MIAVGWGKHSHLVTPRGGLAVCGCPAAYTLPDSAGEQPTCAWCRGWIAEHHYWPLSRLPALEHPPHSGCLTCGSKPIVIELTVQPHPGFGGIMLTRDGENCYDHLHDRDGYHDDRDFDLTVGDIEDIAAGDPDHDWRFTIDAPLYSVTYQRHGEGQWVAVHRGRGFA